MSCFFCPHQRQVESRGPNLYSFSMSVRETLSEQKDRAEERALALARRAFTDYYHRCFWFMKRDLVLTLEDVPYIAQRLRADGGREGLRLARELDSCR
jgi:hypothetical protein